MTPHRAAQFDLPAGTMLGKYEIVRKLAMGGMAEIYLARLRGSAGFEKLVVIKRILPTVANDPKFVQMFLDEARLAATLQHPNIADVHEVGEHDGAPFFAMEFIHGQDVRAIRHAARQRKEMTPLSIALAIVHGTASALDYAHAKTGADGKVLGIVHRDISASNILVSYEGAVKLIDFGIARATSSTLRTQTGTLKGKIPYMSPEQCQGHPLDRRSDLFSLGVVMYELTTGRRPFRGESDFAMMDQIVHKGAPRPSDEMRGYDPELERMVMKLLARDVAARYQSGEELLHDLDPFLAQHRLWVSAKPLSRYMRTMFGESAAAWDISTDTSTLATHLASITGQSGSAELLTPPSSFPSIQPLSQEMPALAAVTGDFELEDPTEGATVAMTDPPPIPPAAVPRRIMTEASIPTLRRSSRGLVIGVVAVVLIGVGMAWFTLRDDGTSSKTTATPTTQAPAPTVTPPPTPAVATPTTPTPPTPPIEKPAVDEPAPPIAKTTPPQKPPPHAKPPVVAKPQVATKPPVKPKPPVDPKPKDPPKDPKDPAWNLDSPFLPH